MDTPIAWDIIVGVGISLVVLSIVFLPLVDRIRKGAYDKGRKEAEKKSVEMELKDVEASLSRHLDECSEASGKVQSEITSLKNALIKIETQVAALTDAHTSDHTNIISMLEGVKESVRENTAVILASSGTRSNDANSQRN